MLHRLRDLLKEHDTDGLEVVVAVWVGHESFVTVAAISWAASLPAASSGMAVRISFGGGVGGGGKKKNTVEQRTDGWLTADFL